MPTPTVNLKAADNFKNVCNLLPDHSRILILGAGIMGNGIDPVYSNESYDIVGSDVAFGPHTNLICDAHDIPFGDEVFDCVIIQAVLEHVIDPQRCVAEVYRVLKPYGLVYAETPFMQQVHMRQYDFTRFTHLGHRRLFRWFEELDSGPACGPGSALVWSCVYFLRSFSSSPGLANFLGAFARLTSFFLKYFDYYLINKAGSYDAASAYFFLGKKSLCALPDRELIKQFKGILS